jgi:hypothetical protein
VGLTHARQKSAYEKSISKRLNYFKEVTIFVPAERSGKKALTLGRRR